MTTTPPGSPRKRRASSSPAPPTRTSSPTTAKEQIEEGAVSERPPKRPRNALEPLPDNPLVFYREPKGTTQISTWNVAGLASCNAEKWKFGFRLYVEAEDPHILAITEVNEQDPSSLFETDPNFEFLRLRYPYRFWSRKVAIVSKFKPVSPPIYGFPEGTRYPAEDARDRALTLEFESCFLLATYVPNSGAEFKQLPRRQNWAADFEPFLRSLDEKKPVIWTGDFNVVRAISPERPNETNDLQWSQNWGKVAGTHQVERDAHERLLGPQPWLKDPKRPGPLFVDIWRLIHGPDWRQYTHSSKKLGGWRIDGFIVSERFLWRIRKCEIRQDVKRKFWPAKDVVKLGALSDHWPVWLSLEMESL
ncbi:hypothetical protein JCM10908_002466 [Rhodotorula pacifica]|uniref:uncharacterized protein n=1 Tax=Rhodotorula pacifica TaxID=1495444 RepID=UPI00318112FC